MLPNIMTANDRRLAAIRDGILVAPNGTVATDMGSWTAVSFHYTLLLPWTCKRREPLKA